MSFTKTNLKNIRADIHAALATVEATYNCKFDLGRITFTDNNFRGKLECNSTSDRSGNTINPAEQNFDQNRWKIGIAKEAFGKSFRVNGTKYTITGINTRAKKYPVQATNPQGATYKFAMRQLPANLKA